MRKIYASMELSNRSIRLVVAELIKNELHVLAAKEQSTTTIDQNEVINQEQLTRDIIKLKQEVEGMVGFTIDQTLVIFDSNHASYQLVAGYSTITHEGKRVTADDLTRAIQASVYNKLSDQMELITVMPVEFYIDNVKVETPLNQIGDKLLVKGVMAAIPNHKIPPLVQALDNAGIKVVDIGIVGISDYNYLYYHENNEKRGVIAHVGTDTTTISYFNRGIIVKSEVIYVGSLNVVKDLSYVFNLHFTEAKRLYERFAMATTRLANVNETISVINKEQVELNLNQYEVSEVVMARLVEIFKLVKMSIKNLTNKEISYIMFTGVASETPGFKALLSETVGTGIGIGEVKTMGARENGYISVLGNIYYFINKMKLKGKLNSMYKDIPLTEARQSKENVLDKIFNYFKED